MRKVLILGASGLLGRYLRASLAAAGLDVVAQSRSADRGCDASFDPAEPDGLWTQMSRLRPDAIVNAAALTNVDFCEDHIDACYRVNTAVAEGLAGWVLKYDRDCHIVQISTDQVYARVGYQDETQVDLLNVYAFSKYAAEIALRPVPNHTVLRTNFFGRSLTPGRESFSDWIHRSLVETTAIRLAVDIEFNPLSLPTLARCITAVVLRPVHGVFNVGARGAFSKHAFGLRLAEALSLPSTCISACRADELGWRVRRPLDMRMDVRRFESSHGAMPDLEREIERVAGDYLRGNDP